MTHEQPQKRQPEKALRKWNKVQLSLEQKLQKERLSRLIDDLKEQRRTDDLHDTCKMLLELFYAQKAATNFFMKEAADVQFSRELQG